MINDRLAHAVDNPLPFTYVNPNADTKLSHRDRVFVLMNTSQNKTNYSQFLSKNMKDDLNQFHNFPQKSRTSFPNASKVSYSGIARHSGNDLFFL